MHTDATRKRNKASDPGVKATKPMRMPTNAEDHNKIVVASMQFILNDVINRHRRNKEYNILTNIECPDQMYCPSELMHLKLIVCYNSSLRKRIIGN